MIRSITIEIKRGSVAGPVPDHPTGMHHASVKLVYEGGDKTTLVKEVSSKVDAHAQTEALALGMHLTLEALADEKEMDRLGLPENERKAVRKFVQHVAPALEYSPTEEMVKNT